jgi:hypothetical protein
MGYALGVALAFPFRVLGGVCLFIAYMLSALPDESYLQWRRRKDS